MRFFDAARRRMGEAEVRRQLASELDAAREAADEMRWESIEHAARRSAFSEAEAELDGGAHRHHQRQEEASRAHSKMHRELEGAKAEHAAARRQSALAAGQLAALRSSSTTSSSPARNVPSPFSSPTRLPAWPGHVTSGDTLPSPL